MPTFEELIALLREPGEDGLPETIYDDLGTAFADATGTRDAAIAERDSVLQERESEISRLKAMNYDLLMASSNESKGSEETTNTDGGDDVGTVDDFFEDKD